MDPDDLDDERAEDNGAGTDDDDDDDGGPLFAEGLGALGQLATAVIVVALLVAAFIGGSALLRRLFG